MASARCMTSHCLKFIAGASVVCAILVSDASAQDRGWWGRRSRAPMADSAVPAPNAANERDAAQMYADARSDLEAERLEPAQRTLELLVARHPMSALADVARHDLQRIYALRSLPNKQSAQAKIVAPVAPPAAHPSAGLTADGLRPVALPQPGAPRTPASMQPDAAATLPPLAAVRLANEDFRQQAGDRVFFPDGSIELGARARIALEAQANWLNRHPAIRIQLEGHADDQGPRDLNRQLAEGRAAAVKLRLSDLGVHEDRIAIFAHGRNDPVADCPQAHCKAQNRRVVTVISHVPSNLGFDAAARRSLDRAASVVGQPPPRRP